MLKPIPNVGNVTHSCCWLHSNLYRLYVAVLDGFGTSNPWKAESGRIPKIPRWVFSQRTCPWSNWSMAPGDLEVISAMGMSCVGHGITNSMPCNNNANIQNFIAINWGIIYQFSIFLNIQQQPGHWWLVTCPLWNSGREAHLTDFDCLDLTTEVLSRSRYASFGGSWNPRWHFWSKKSFAFDLSASETSISGH